MTKNGTKLTKIVGHKTMIDGLHVPLYEDEAAAIWAQAQKHDAERRTLMPDSMSALHMLADARTRLHDEGWSDAIYCPKDGSEFAVIEYGSTGIFSAFYSGQWPDGHVISCDFVSHPSGMLWKAIDKLSAAEKAQMDKCMEAEKIMHEREIRSFAARSGATDEQ